jgi:hypothetical protein
MNDFFRLSVEFTAGGGRINFGKTAFTAVFWQTGGLRGF